MGKQGESVFRSGIREEANGFVGQSWSIKSGVTHNGRAFLEFDLSCGAPTPEYNIVATWRHVVVFGEDAVIYKDLIHQGARVSVIGFLRTEEYTGKDGETKKRDKLIANQPNAMRIIEAGEPEIYGELTRA